MTNCQFGLLPGDSCISELLSTVHEINLSFDCSPSIDVRGVSLDILKAFDKALHQGLIFKLKLYGVKGKFLDLMTNYLHGQMQNVVLIGQCSSWELKEYGVPQGSVLGLLLFLIYINDLRNNVKSTFKIFVDDTSLFSPDFDKNYSRNELNTDLQVISHWVYKWKLRFDLDPNKQAQQAYFSQEK